MRVSVILHATAVMYVWCVDTNIVDGWCVQGDDIVWWDKQTCQEKIKFGPSSMLGWGCHSYYMLLLSYIGHLLTCVALLVDMCMMLVMYDDEKERIKEIELVPSSMLAACCHHVIQQSKWPNHAYRCIRWQIYDVRWHIGVWQQKRTKVGEAATRNNIQVRKQRKFTIEKFNGDNGKPWIVFLEEITSKNMFSRDYEGWPQHLKFVPY